MQSEAWPTSLQTQVRIWSGCFLSCLELKNHALAWKFHRYRYKNIKNLFVSFMYRKGKFVESHVKSVWKLVKKLVMRNLFQKSMVLTGTGNPFNKNFVKLRSNANKYFRQFRVWYVPTKPFDNSLSSILSEKCFQLYEFLVIMGKQLAQNTQTPI